MCACLVQARYGEHYGVSCSVELTGLFEKREYIWTCSQDILSAWFDKHRYIKKKKNNIQYYYRNKLSETHIFRSLVVLKILLNFLDQLFFGLIRKFNTLRVV